MEPKLTTDEDTNRFFDSVVLILEESGKYSYEEACAVTREYYEKFRNEEYCKSINLRVQDDDFFFHQGKRDMARRIHYYLTLKGAPKPSKYIEWRTRLKQE